MPLPCVFFYVLFRYVCTDIIDGSLRVDGFRCSLRCFGLWYTTVILFYFEEFIFVVSSMPSLKPFIVFVVSMLFC